MIDPPLVVPFLEAARLLGLTAESNAYKMRREGRFPVRVLEVGGKLFVSRKQLEEFVDGPAEATA